MSNKYRRLCAGDRAVIANMRQAGKKQIEIAQAIGSSQATISKELSRNRGERGYRSAQADRLARERKSEKRTRPQVMVGILKDEVEARLMIKHSPDQISNSLALKGFKVSHETIYQHVARDRKAGGDLSLHLRINGKRRYRRRSKIGRGEKIPNRVDIEERPMLISGRNRYGDWEADLIQGAAGSGFLISIYERKSRVGKLHLLPDKCSAGTMNGIVTVLNGLKVHSITYDNVLKPQVAANEIVTPPQPRSVLQEICFMQPAMLVGLISIMTGHGQQEDIATSARLLVTRGEDILRMTPGSPSFPNHENQNTPVPRTLAARAPPV